MHIDFTRKAWLPDDWCQGVKRTHGGNTYVVFLPPTEIRTLYHQWQIEDYLGRKLGPQDGFKGQLRLAKLAREQVQLDPEDASFALLSAHERAQLVDGSAFHFCIVSARRAQVPEGARDIAVAQDAFTSSGVTPAWLRGLHMPARLKWARRLRCGSTSRQGLIPKGNNEKQLLEGAY